MERQKDDERVRDGAGDRERCKRDSKRETEKLRENVIWSGVLGCMLHLPSLTERESDGHWQELNQ